MSYELHTSLFSSLEGNLHQSHLSVCSKIYLLSSHTHHTLITMPIPIPIHYISTLPSSSPSPQTPHFKPRINPTRVPKALSIHHTTQAWNPLQHALPKISPQHQPTQHFPVLLSRYTAHPCQAQSPSTPANKASPRLPRDSRPMHARTSQSITRASLRAAMYICSSDMYIHVIVGRYIHGECTCPVGCPCAEVV